MDVIHLGVKTVVPRTDLVAAPAQAIVLVAGISGSFVCVPELECVVDKLAVLAHGADHGMIAQ